MTSASASRLLALTPGASPIDTAQTFGFRGVGAFDFPSFHGARNRANLFLVDGINDQVSIASTPRQLQFALKLQF